VKNVPVAPHTDVATRGRPRSVEADTAIRSATIELLIEDGFGRLTMASVAARAGVSTATLYRRWSSKLDLVVGVLGDRSNEIPVPDTGSLRGDLHAVLSSVRRTRSNAADDDRLLAASVSELARNPELAEAVRENLIRPRRRALAGMLERAERRGDCRPGVDHDLVMDLIFGPVHSRQLFTGQPFTAGVVDALVDLVLRAVAPDVTKETPGD
jgi:AcrR family transcriptional regulator